MVRCGVHVAVLNMCNVGMYAPGIWRGEFLKPAYIVRSYWFGLPLKLGNRSRGNAMRRLEARAQTGRDSSVGWPWRGASDTVRSQQTLID